MLVAIISTNRKSGMEYIARDKTEVMDTLNMLWLVEGDIAIVRMVDIPQEQLAGLPEASADAVATWEGYQETLLITERVEG